MCDWWFFLHFAIFIVKIMWSGFGPKYFVLVFRSKNVSAFFLLFLGNYLHFGQIVFKPFFMKKNFFTLVLSALSINLSNFI